MIKHLRQAWPLGIRAQLTLLYTGIFALLVLLFSAVFFVSLQRSLFTSFDAALQLRTDEIATGVAVQGGTITIQDVTGELPGLSTEQSTGQSEHADTAGGPASDGGATGGPNITQPDVRFGTLVRVLDAHGHLVYTSPGFRALLPPAASVTEALHGRAWRGTIGARNGQAVRLYSAPLSDNGRVYGVVQVGEPLAAVEETLRSAALGLLVLAPFMLLLGVLGSYWLARRAFRPVVRLTRTARAIEAEDLHRRVPVPPARDEVRDLALTLNDMIERLEHAFEQQRRFVADASHELRTPVAAILALADVALEEPGAGRDVSQAMRDVQAMANRLGQLLNALLTLARADEGALPLQLDPVRLDLLAKDAAAVIDPLAVQRAIRLDVQTSTPVTVIGDEERLIQVLLNLLNNALQYTPAGGTVQLAVALHNGSARLTVRDTGSGIAAEHLPHLFERFYRADPARTRALGGSGLGLSIVEWIVRAHDGTVAVESRVGQGTLFTITLPLASVPGQRSAVTPEGKSRAG
ncbi:MAG: ATP-binding protein [Ktedonobacterales bacterium]